MGHQLFPDLQQVAPAHQPVYRGDAQLCHVLPQLLGHEVHEVDNILRLPGKSFSQFRVLCGNARRTGIQAAYPHHTASHCYQGRCGEAEFLRSQHTGNGHIPPGHQLAVGLNNHLTAQSVLDQRLVGLRHTQLPGQARSGNGAAGSRASAAVMAGDQHHLRSRLGHARRDGAYTGFADQFDANPRTAVDVLHIINELGQIFNRIDVVVGRR